MDYLPLFASSGEIRGPAGSGRVAAVARSDLADAAVGVLLAPGEHDARSYDLAGPEGLSMARIAKRLGVPYVKETLDEARASRAPSGAPDWEIEGWVTTYAAVAAGELDVVTDAVGRLAGHPPMTLDEFLAAGH
jgi:NAD(P)H dehydrogenase (quinone)